MNKNNNDLNDYQDFLNSNQTAIPAKIKERTFSKLQRLIRPNAWIVFLKLLGIHGLMGFLSLSVCHQFGLNPFNTERSMADWFMNVGGHHFCMLACGVVFVSASLLGAGLIFTVEEVRSLKRNDLLQNVSLGVISLAAFAAFGAELALSIAGLWFVGSIVGGLISMAAIFKIKGVTTSAV